MDYILYAREKIGNSHELSTQYQNVLLLLVKLSLRKIIFLNQRFNFFLQLQPILRLTFHNCTTSALNEELLW